MRSATTWPLIRDGGTPGPGTVNCPVKYRPFTRLLFMLGLNTAVCSHVFAKPYALPGKSPAAHKAMVQAAKAMAGLGVKALAERDLIDAAKADLQKRTARMPYVCPLPENVSPPLDMSRT